MLIITVICVRLGFYIVLKHYLLKRITSKILNGLFKVIKFVSDDMLVISHSFIAMSIDLIKKLSLFAFFFASKCLDILIK